MLSGGRDRGHDHDHDRDANAATPSIPAVLLPGAPDIHDVRYASPLPNGGRPRLRLRSSDGGRDSTDR